MARGHARKTSTRGVEELAGAVRTALLAEGCQEIRESRDGREHRFVTRRSALAWELDGVASVAPDGDGSLLTVTLTGRADSPGARLDGWKTRRAAERLARTMLG